MRFIFLFLGKTKEHYLAEGIRDYANRLTHYFPTELVTLKPKYPANPSDIQIKQKEAELLLERSANGSLRVVLDPRGTKPDSPELAATLKRWQERGLRDIYFLIGGHLGVNQEVRKKSDFILSLSAFTFTHDMTRLILLEQVYRACTINAGSKYHK